MSTRNTLANGLIAPNLVNAKKGYHISYNNVDTSQSLYGCDTTAIYIEETSQFLILNGQHMKELSACSSLSDCIAYFYDNIKLANKRSEHGKLFKFNDNNELIAVDGGF